MNSISQDVPIRDAATVVIRRIISGKPHVLMGQRGRNAVFMPNKFVFPGGSIDEQDEYVQLAKNISPDLKKFLSYKAYTARPNAILSECISLRQCVAIAYECDFSNLHWSHIHGSTMRH